MNITALLSGRRFFLYYKDFALIAGKNHTAGIFLAHLINLYDYFESKGQLHDGKWFFATGESIEKEIYISPKHQRAITAKFEKMGIVQTKLIKLTDAPRKYFSINKERLSDAIDQANQPNRLGTEVPIEWEQRPETYKVLEKNKDKKNKEDRLRTRPDACASASVHQAEDKISSKDAQVIPYDVVEVIDAWNCEEKLPKARATDSQITAIKKAIKKRGVVPLVQAIKNYGWVMSLKKTWWTYKWNIVQFVQRENAWNTFAEENFIEDQFVEKSKAQRLMEKMDIDASKEWDKIFK